MNIRHILIPVDFSEGSTQAIEYGVALANKFSSRVTLFHVTQPLATPPEGPMFPFDPYQQAMTDAAWKQLRELSTTLVLDTEVEIDLISGIPWASIVDRAKSGGIDLIVMPTHGRTALKHLLMGSVAERVVRHAHCPVLVVRQHLASNQQG